MFNMVTHFPGRNEIYTSHQDKQLMMKLTFARISLERKGMYLRTI